VTLPLFPSGPLLDATKAVTLRPYQQKLADQIRMHVRAGVTRILACLPTGCHARGQRVLMFEGSLRCVEDVRVDDLLMGPNSEARCVTEIHRGSSILHRIIPVNGDPWIVNTDHVLTLVRTNEDRWSPRNGEIVDVTVRDWLQWPRWRKHIHKLFRVPVRFHEKQLPLSPYFIGLYLGDGWSTHSLAFACGKDQELIEAVTTEAQRFGIDTRVDDRGTQIVIYFNGGSRGGYVRTALRDLGLEGLGSGCKFIPQSYLTSSVSQRFELLAGLIDTDGALTNGGFDFVSKSERLARDVAFLSRSLGLAAYVSRCSKSCQNGYVGTYWRVSISGETHKVPVRIPRKRPHVRAQKKNVLRTGFKIEPFGEGDFFGFSLDRDKRYLLDDFTVTHNSGKMVVIAHLVKTSRVPVLFVAHRLELIDQCARELARMGLSHVGVLRGADEREDPSATVQVASIQTLARRAKPPAGLVFIDEAHRAVSDSYVDHVFSAYPEAIIVGFTATPCRHDNKPLGQHFQRLEIGATYSQLIKAKYIVAPHCYSSPFDPDLARVKLTGGDFDLEQLGDVMNDSTLVGNIVEHWLALADKYPRPGIGYDIGTRRKTFLFATTIRHSKALVARFGAAGVRIAHLDGDTPETERRDMLRALAAGELEIVSNCNVLLEGVDVPAVKCVAHARPTHSLVLYMQSAGRMLRPWCCRCDKHPSACGHPSTPPLLLDHAGNVDRHGLPHEDRIWSISDAQRRSGARVPIKKCPRCFAYLDTGRVICPHCGFEFPPPEARTNPNENDEALALRSSESARQAFYEQHVLKARILGFKPGWPSVKFKEKFGAWPPYAWKDATQAQFASDPRWQAALAHREAGKKKDAGDHHCHAHGCKIACAPEKLMCAAHWRKVPSDLQAQVYATYRAGQCDDRNPSAAWMAAADRAIAAIAKKEGHNQIATHLEDQATRWESRAHAAPGASAIESMRVERNNESFEDVDYDDFKSWLESEGIG